MKQFQAETISKILTILVFSIFVLSCGGGESSVGNGETTDNNKNDVGDSSGFDDGLCDDDSDCNIGELCVGGVCTTNEASDAGKQDAEGAEDGSDTGDSSVNPDGTPKAEVEAPTLDFTTVRVGDTKPLNASIKNTGDGMLVISIVALEKGDVGFELANLPSFPQNVEPNKTLTIEVKFAPTEAGSASDTLKFVHNAEGSPSQVSLVGVGTGGAPVISVSPSDKVTFDSTAVGNTSPPKRVVIKNNGQEGANDLEITEISIPEPGNEEFQITTQLSFPILIPAGKTSELQLTFAPKENGSRAGVLTIKSNDLNTPLFSLPLEGVGQAAGADLSPGSLDFGEVVFGQESAEKRVTVSNTGSAAFQINAIDVSPPSFVITKSPQPLPATVAIGAAREIWVKFVPQSEGTFNGELKITTTIPQNPELKVPLTGVGMSLPVDQPVASAEVYNAGGVTETSMVSGAGYVELDGSKSTDPTPPPNSGIVSYNWEIFSGPSGADGTITQVTSDSRRVKFVATVLGTYKIRLIVINKGGKASTNEAVITIHVLKQDTLRIEADWTHYDGSACTGGEVCDGDITNPDVVCAGDERDVDLILSKGTKSCRAKGEHCNWNDEYGSPSWSANNSACYQKPEVIDFTPNPLPSAFSATVSLEYISDYTNCNIGLACDDTKCQKAGVCVQVSVSVSGVGTKTYSGLILRKAGDKLDVCGIEYNYGEITIIDH